jgi:hypothetical protein
MNSVTTILRIASSCRAAACVGRLLTTHTNGEDPDRHLSRIFSPHGVRARSGADASCPRRAKLHNRLLRPLLAADQPRTHPTGLRSALRTIDHQIEGYITHARLGQAA